ncbi:LOW QUALITY PROTEIN: cAMP-dependent protein kinase inhibitor gamma [Malaclemys terrapin pileata]|uniref:LOW QUALITY PROTEIN: cAMP-dependent protein kinase inhibitor gamma n=1 Tax=Malaclemys terrapin pileata TaxID=2991368 RepID=UPI0023A8D250|nr:LOW QUALITY PROTEIN: cAMP-dependent protein kinase inhibitor gamma [Malaclemys terrapin pileata]
MEIEPSYTDFISCDRTGRRNAIHDIQGDATSISMRQLAGDIGELSIEGAGNQAAASEKEPEARLEGQDGTPHHERHRSGWGKGGRRKEL